jgi:hypothetical protein
LFHGLHELGPVLGALHRKLAEAEGAAEATRSAAAAPQAARAAHVEHRPCINGGVRATALTDANSPARL